MSTLTSEEDLCEDCPPVGYPTDKTRCLPCPRRPVVTSSDGGNATTSSDAGNASPTSKTDARDTGRTCEPVARTSNPWDGHAPDLVRDNKLMHELIAKQDVEIVQLRLLVCQQLEMDRALGWRSASWHKAAVQFMGEPHAPETPQQASNQCHCRACVGDHAGHGPCTLHRPNAIPCWAANPPTWYQTALKNDCAHCEIERLRELLSKWVTYCDLSGARPVSADVRDNPVLQLLKDSREALPGGSSTSSETEARRCDVEVRAWMIEWPANGNMPARWWHPVTGWMLDANSAVRFVREEDAEAYMRNAGFVKGIVATEHAWIESQLQQETGLCLHGMPQALSECLPCVGANSLKASVVGFSGPPCVCGEPNTPGVTHRTDGPCFVTPQR